MSRSNIVDVNVIGTVDITASGSLNIDTLQQVDNVDVLQQVDNVTNLGTLNLINNLDLVNTVNQVNGVQNVATVDNVFNVGGINQVPDPYYQLMNNEYPNAVSHLTYSRVITSNDWQTIIPDEQNVVKQLIPAPNLQLAFSANFGVNPVDTTAMINVTAYENPNSTQVSTFLIVLNGTNKVLFQQPMYRIVNITLAPSSPTLPNCDFYIYDAALNPDVFGTPASWFDYARFGNTQEDSNWRETGIYYNPPGRISVVNSFWFSSDLNDNGSDDIGEICLELSSPSSNFVLFRRRLFFNRFSFQNNRPQLIVPPQWTVHMQCRQTNGGANRNVNFNINWVQLNLPPP